MLIAYLSIGSRIKEEHGEVVWTVAGWDPDRKLVCLELHDVNTASAGIVPPEVPVVPVETRNDVEGLLVPPEELEERKRQLQGVFVKPREQAPVSAQDTARLQQALRSQPEPTPMLRRTPRTAT